MNLYILQQYRLINDLYQNGSYIDILINIDDFFDILNLYVFPNWLDTEVVELKVMKYFTNIVLKSPYKKMPHPKGSVLLTKYDCRVQYKETTEYIPVEVKSEEDTYVDEKTGVLKPKVKKEKVWLVDIMIPNKLIINDELFDMKTAQEKIEEENEESESLDMNNE